MTQAPASPVPAPIQTLAAGATRSTKYGTLGGYSGRSVLSLSKCTAMFLGLPGEGKSALLQSNPDAYIFNMDLSSTVTDTPLAVMYPGLDPATGMPTNDEGRPFVFEYGDVRTKLDVLRTLAAENRPRPSTVVFDSLTAWVRLLKAWVPRNAKMLNIAAENKDDFKDLHGPAAWDALYDQVVAAVRDLRNCGYGVHIVGHIVNNKVQIGDNQFEVAFGLPYTAKFWNRLVDMLEFSGVVYVGEASEEYTETKTSVVRGQTTVSNIPKTRTVRAHYITTRRAGLDGITKSRVKLPDQIRLSNRNGWAELESVYAAAARGAA